MTLPRLEGSRPALRDLSELATEVDGVDLRGDVGISGISHDSRRIRPGWLFLAARGKRLDGHLYARDAVAAGAAALVVERFLDIPVPQLRVRSVRTAMGPLASAFYSYPSDNLAIVGVTGTNGKTTTCELLRTCVESAGWRSGQIGTIATRIGRIVEPAGLTTPEAPDLQAALSRMVDAGVRAAALEVSSHALDRNRIDGTHFDVGVFTNLSAEHLDYHGTIEQYWASKARLFEPGRCASALVCIDDEWGKRLAGQTAVPVTTFGRHQGADVTVKAHARGLRGTTVELNGIDGGVVLHSRIVGLVNAIDIAGAYLSARAIGISAANAKAGIEKCEAPPGRFELVKCGQPFLVVCDYAHTPDALEALLCTARDLLDVGGRIHMVVGARGDRDRLKRPAIGKIAASADRVIFTTDSPGAENADAIIEQLCVGAREVAGARINVECDRRNAIRLAVSQAEPGDVVLIVGRGHEQTQLVNGHTVLFDDRVAAREVLRGHDAWSRVASIEQPGPQLGPD